ncbi:MAG: hypothetical protein ACRERE_15615 [Candidatus Entotheonellia bacterium]
MRDLPIMCELTPDEIKARRAALLLGLLAQAEERTTLPDGFRWRFVASGKFLAAAAETIDAERQCCRFLRFVLTIEPDGGPMWLEITGPQGTVEFLETLIRA